MKMIIKLLNTYLTKKRYPFSVNFIICYRCNYKCKYCNSYNQKTEEMTTEQIIKMIDELSKIGMQRLSITGGEPLLRKDIGQIIDYCKKKNIWISINSNGKLIPQKINELKNVDALLISLDGKKENHEKFRGKDSYKDVINAIKIAKQNNIAVWIEAVITKNSKEDIDFLLDLAKKLDFRCLFQPIYNYSYSANKKIIKDYSPTKENFDQIIKKLIKLKKQGEPILNSNTYLKYIINNWPNPHLKKCYAGRIFCGINSNGKVAPCSLLFNNPNWPNGTEIGFKEAFKRLSPFKCKGCFCNSFIDLNFAYSLKVEPIINALRNYLKKSKDSMQPK